MKKILVLAACGLSLSLTSFAQHFRNGLGVGIYVEDAPYDDTKVGLSLTYSPTLFFAEQEKTSFSVGIPISLGVHAGTTGDYFYNGYNEYTRVSAGVMVDIPAIVNFNYGAGAVMGSRDKWGFFVGGGYGYHMTTQQYVGDSYEETFTNNTFGITGNAGFRIGLGTRRRHNLEVKFSYMKGLTDYKPNVYGVNCLFNF
jgi:outer membrane protein W